MKRVAFQNLTTEENYPLVAVSDPIKGIYVCNLIEIILVLERDLGDCQYPAVKGKRILFVIVFEHTMYCFFFHVYTPPIFNIVP